MWLKLWTANMKTVSDWSHVRTMLKSEYLAIYLQSFLQLITQTCTDVQTYLGNKVFHHFSMPPSSADSKTLWTNFPQVLQQQQNSEGDDVLEQLAQKDVTTTLTDRVWGICYDDVEGILVLLHEFKAISNMECELGTEKPIGHPWEELLGYINDILSSRKHVHRHEHQAGKTSAYRSSLERS